jgi:hypothetical protein
MYLLSGTNQDNGNRFLLELSRDKVVNPEFQQGDTWELTGPSRAQVSALPESAYKFGMDNLYAPFFEYVHGDRSERIRVPRGLPMHFEGLGYREPHPRPW